MRAGGAERILTACFVEAHEHIGIVLRFPGLSVELDEWGSSWVGVVVRRTEPPRLSSAAAERPGTESNRPSSGQPSPADRAGPQSGVGGIRHVPEDGYDASNTPQGRSFRIVEHRPGELLVVRTRPSAWAAFLAATGVAGVLLVFHVLWLGFGLSYLMASPLKYLNQTPATTLLGMLFSLGLAGFWAFVTASIFLGEWGDLRATPSALTSKGLLKSCSLPLADVRAARFEVGSYRRPYGPISRHTARLVVETSAGWQRMFSWSAPGRRRADLNLQIAFLRRVLPRECREP